MTARRRTTMTAFCAPIALGQRSCMEMNGAFCTSTLRVRSTASRRPRLLPRASAGGGADVDGVADAPVRIALVATATATRNEARESTQEAGSGGGFLGMKARAYWKSIGFLPLFFGGLGILALSIKAIKVMQGRWTSTDGVNRAMTPESIITTEEQEAELHVFKCGGCGYEMYPARGREFKFFPDNFKCPLCGSPKSAFWDLKDPNDPRNWDEDPDDDGNLQTAAVDDPAGSGTATTK